MINKFQGVFMRLAEKKQYLLLLALFQTSLLFNATSSSSTSGAPKEAVAATVAAAPAATPLPLFAPSAVAAPAVTTVPSGTSVRAVTPPHQPVQLKAFGTPADRLSSDGGARAAPGEESAFYARTLSGGTAAPSVTAAAPREATGGATTRSLSSERKAQIAEFKAFTATLGASERKRGTSAEKPTPSALPAAGGAGAPSHARRPSTEGTSATAEDYDVVKNWKDFFKNKAEEKIRAIFEQALAGTSDDAKRALLTKYNDLARSVVQQSIELFYEVRGFLPHYTQVTNLKAVLRPGTSVSFKKGSNRGPIAKLLAIDEKNPKLKTDEAVNAAIDELNGIMGELLAALAIELGPTGRMVVAFSQQRGKDLEMDLVVASKPCTGVEAKNRNPRELITCLRQFEIQKQATEHLGFAYEVFSIAPIPAATVEELTAAGIAHESFLPSEESAAASTSPHSEFASPRSGSTTPLSPPSGELATARSNNLAKIMKSARLVFGDRTPRPAAGGGGAGGRATPRSERRRASTLTSPSSAAAAAAAASPHAETPLTLTTSADGSPLFRSPDSALHNRIARKLEFSASSPQTGGTAVPKPAKSTDPAARAAEFEAENTELIEENRRLKLLLDLLRAERNQARHVLSRLEGAEAAETDAGRAPMGRIQEEELGTSSTPGVGASAATPLMLSPFPTLTPPGAVKTTTPEEEKAAEATEDAAEA